VQLGATGAAGRYTLTLGLDCYPLLRRWIQQSPDDHSPYNVEQLIVSFWTCANTDDQSGGGRWKGTTLADMKSCADSWLQAQNLDQNYTRQVVRRPAFPEVAREIERSEDIVLLLGFYWQTGPATWARCGGHYVTAAGVDRANATITVSDPYYNNAEPPASGGNGGPGRVRGPGHGNHAPGLPPYPDHDDAVNLSHDRYATGPSMVGPAVSLWSLVGYATPGRPTTCEDVINFCYGMEYGQNPPEYPATQYPCPGPATPISVEVEAMVDVSPVQTPVCILLDPAVAWPDNLRVTKGACDPAQATLFSYDVIRGKRCGLGFSGLPAVSDLGHVTCLYDNVARDRFDETSPDDDLCFGPWFYLVRQSGDLNYGSAQPGGEPELPSSGGCP
jgi:hypothetical protein